VISPSVKPSPIDIPCFELKEHFHALWVTDRKCG
jgi:hypothetical protein